MGIQLQEKPKPKLKSPRELAELVPYRVVSVSDKDSGVEVDDVVLRFPAHGHGCYLLNVTKQKMLWDKASDSNWHSFSCLRAHHVAAISFSVDYDERPE